MTTTLIDPILSTSRNGNSGVVPPWLQYPPIGVYPMPEPPADPMPSDDDE